MEQETQLHSQNSQFFGWATGDPAPKSALRIKREYSDALLNLPLFKNVDIIDLYHMVEDKLTYKKGSGLLQGKHVQGIQITSRAFAIALLVGVRKLDDPTLQVSNAIDPVTKFCGESL
jgi:hypothetical protein